MENLKLENIQLKKRILELQSKLLQHDWDNLNLQEVELIKVEVVDGPTDI